MKKKGVIKFFHQNGWGFIKPERGEKDIFFHKSQIKEGKPDKEKTVWYDEGEGKKGVMAVNISCE